MRVLLEVGHRLARWLAGVPSGADEVEGGLGDVVGVDLVTQQQQDVRPDLAWPVDEAARIGRQRVESAAV